jgi:cytoskeleton protein RodZ
LSQNGSQLKNSGVSTVKSTEALNPAQQRQFNEPVNASIAPLGALHAKNPGGMDTAEQAWAALSEQVLPEGESRLQLIVSADSWVEITDASGQELEMDLLRGGSDKAYHGEPPFKILLGRASAVRLSMDGEAVDLTAFTRDDVAQLSLPRKLQVETSEPDSN